MPLLILSSVYSLPAPFCPPLWLCQKHFLRGTFSSTRAEPLLQHSQGPQCYCFQLKKKNISSSPSSFPSPPPSSALRHRGDLQEGVGSIDLGNMPVLHPQQQGTAFPRLPEFKASSSLGNGLGPCLGIPVKALHRC